VPFEAKVNSLAAIFSGFESGFVLNLVKHTPIALSQIRLPRSFKLWCWQK
jgi:hypothetical protein